MKRVPTDSRLGLTLAELLIALAIAGMVIAIAAAGARQVIAFERRLEAERAGRDQLNAGLAALRVRLERSLAIPAPADEADPETDAESAGAEAEEAYLFRGDASGFSFVSADPGYPTEPGLYEYRIDFMPAEDDAAARVRLARRRLDDPASFGTGEAGFQSWPLFETAHPIRADYGGGGEGWSTDWSPENGMPRMLRLSLDGDAIPLLTVSLGAAVRPPDPGSEDEADAPGDDRPDAPGRRDRP